MDQSSNGKPGKRKTTRKSEEQSTPSAPQHPLPDVRLSIREFYNERHRYNVNPRFQRKDVWTVRMAQAWIDSILLGDPLHPMEAYKAYSETGETTYDILDGHQRTMAIRDFMEGKFKTWSAAQKRLAEPGSEPPVEPGKYYDELSVIAKNHFLECHLQINLIRKRSEKQITTRFLRIQNHMPLTAAERFNAYQSKAKDAARRIEMHPFWEDFYMGKTNREQVLQSCLYLLAIELTAPSGLLDLQSSALLQNLVSGEQDHAVTDELVEAVLDRLSLVTHVYHGTHFTARGAIVAMYQSIMYLEHVGYTVQQQDKGRLTAWISGLMASSSRAATMPTYNRPIQPTSCATR